MKIKDLEQITNIQTEINVLNLRLDKCFALSFVGDVVNDYRTGSAIPYVIRGYSEVQAERAEKIYKRLRELKSDLVDKTMAAEEFILSLEDSRMRSLLTLRYLEGKSWRDTAKAFSRMTADSARMTVMRYFENEDIS